MNNKIFEWAGVITAILYSLFVALNIGIEFFGFCLLLLSAILIGIWAYRGGHKGILFLQFFYATAGIIGPSPFPLALPGTFDTLRHLFSGPRSLTGPAQRRWVNAPARQDTT